MRAPSSNLVSVPAEIVRLDEYRSRGFDERIADLALRIENLRSWLIELERRNADLSATLRRSELRAL